MAIADVTHARPASASDYIALLKPRVMSLVVFTGLVGYMVAPGQGRRCPRFRCYPRHRSRRRRRWRAEHVVRLRHRRDHVAYADAPHSRRPRRPRRGARPRPHALRAFGADHVARGERARPRRCSPSRSSSTWSSTRCGLKRSTPQNIVIGGSLGCAATRDRLGRQDRRAGARSGHHGRHHLHVDAAALLGAVAPFAQGLRRRACADVAGDATAPNPRAATSSAYSVLLAPIGPCSSAYGPRRTDLRRHRRPRRRALPLPRVPRPQLTRWRG